MNSYVSEPIPDKKSVTWPKRASKACATCRRDKIRCDGGRPCTSCAKKGYTNEDCTDGCEHCRRARVRCEGGKPCQRCQDLKVECNVSKTASASAHQPVLSAVPRITQRGERAKLACSSCRRDNKKCDDQRPCSRCIIRCEDCIHVGRGPKLVQLRCEGCRDANKRCEDSRPCRYCIEGSKECISVPRKGKGHGTRVKVACTSCRRDKIRCNGERPCASCVKKGVKCVERVCKACSMEGKTIECAHQKFQDSGFADKEGVSTFRGENGVKPNLQGGRSTYAEFNYRQEERTQWYPYVYEYRPHDADSMPSRIIPPPQFPPQVSSQSVHAPMTHTWHTIQPRYSEASVYDSYRNYGPSQYRNHSPSFSSSSLPPLR